MDIETKRNVDKNFLNKIDTKEKAYIVGFLLGDSFISKSNTIQLKIAIKDKDLIYEIDNYIPWECTIKEDLRIIKEQKKFPSISIQFHSTSFAKNLKKHFGGRLKVERHTPIIKKSLEPYLLKGFFDADGTITFGHRKDRNRLWQKVSFISQEKILIGIQKILYKNSMSTMIRRKSKEKAYCMSLCSEYDVYKFYKYLPKDIGLKRKITKLENWLEEVRKKYSFKDGDIIYPTSITTMKKYKLDIINLKGKYIVDNTSDIKYPSYYFNKKGIFFAPLRLELDENGKNLIGIRQYRAKPSETEGVETT